MVCYLFTKKIAYGCCKFESLNLKLIHNNNCFGLKIDQFSAEIGVTFH